MRTRATRASNASNASNPSRASAAVIAAGVGLFCLGCRTECTADQKASPEQLAREQKAVLRGQGTCKELVTPRVVLADDRLLLTSTKENVIARRSELSASEIQRVTPLDERLRQYREHFRLVRAAEPFEPTIYVTLDPTLEPARAFGVLGTAAHAGYPRSRVYVGKQDLTLGWWLPSDRNANANALCVDEKPRGTFAVRLDGRELPPRQAPALDALGPTVAQLCTTSHAACADVVAIDVDPAATLGDAASVIAAVLSAPPFDKHPPAVVLGAHVPTAWRGKRLSPCL